MKHQSVSSLEVTIVFDPSRKVSVERFELPSECKEGNFSLWTFVSDYSFFGEIYLICSINVSMDVFTFFKEIQRKSFLFLVLESKS